MRIFDQKFGPKALADVPSAPGVYRFFDAEGQLVYVGKAKRLVRRLAQYRTATKARRHRRMRLIVKAAASFSYEVTASHLDACLLELRLIQELAPRLNIASAYSHRYPFVGLAQRATDVQLLLTSSGEFPLGFTMFGAFRSREVCAEGFFSLVRLASLVGHKEARAVSCGALRRKYTYAYGFRRLPPLWVERWSDFFAGRSREALTELSLALLELPGARARSREIESDLRALLRFWNEEASSLRQVLEATGYEGLYPVPQRERDPLFIRFREASR